MDLFFKKLINELFFNLRNSIRYSKPITHRSHPLKPDLFQDPHHLQEEEKLIRNYHLHVFKQETAAQTYQENLYTLKLLEDIFTNYTLPLPPESLKVLDIGSKNFAYATAIYHFCKYFPPEQAPERTIYLDGIEIDPYRIMADLHSRYDYAIYHIRNLKNTRYIPGDLLKFHENKYDLITWFLPFITETPLLKWGLPLQYLQPEAMINHAYNLLNSRGIILIINQFESEREKQLEILKNLGINQLVEESPYSNIFSPFQLKRYITIIKKH